MLLDLDVIKSVYTTLPERVHTIRKAIGRPLTLTEKILYGHFVTLPTVSAARGRDYANLTSDGVASSKPLENDAFPGGLLLGADKNIPQVGALGMLAIRVGGTEASTQTGKPFKLLFPKVIGVQLSGLFKGKAPKDLIGKLSRLLPAKTAENSVIEYLGEGAETISCPNKAILCEMGSDLGALTSIFPYDAQMASYLKASGRGEVAQVADKVAEYLRPHIEVLEHPEDYYDQVLEVFLTDI